MGRKLGPQARQTIRRECPRDTDLQVVIGDGLSARAVAALRQILGGTITDVFPTPEVLVNGVMRKFDGDTLTDEVEPFLLRAELVVRTPRGRNLTTAGYEHLGSTPPEEKSTPEEPERPLFD